jgi:pimeloyl-ACP methyl ester carboxylesterase
MQLEVITRNPAAPTNKPPLLFVHGAWHGAWCWEPHFLPAFAAQGYPSTALSFRAHGHSEGRNRLRGKRITQYADDVAQVAAQFDQPPILIAHSMGTLVAQKYLEKHPAKATVLLAPVPPNGVSATTLRMARRHPGPFTRANFTLSLYPFVATPAMARDAFFSADLPDAQVTLYQQQMQDEAYLAFLDMVLFQLPNARRVRANNPTMPILILGGAEDRVFPPREVQATAKKYATTAEIFPHMAHDMMLEADWQSVADRIVAWLGEQHL